MNWLWLNRYAVPVDPGYTDREARRLSNLPQETAYRAANVAIRSLPNDLSTSRLLPAYPLQYIAIRSEQPGSRFTWKQRNSKDCSENRGA